MFSSVNIFLDYNDHLETECFFKDFGGFDEEPAQPPFEIHPAGPSEKQRTRGPGVCSHCGNETDKWVDLEG